MDPNTASKNLASIRNIDPCAEAILDKVNHTALYRFNNVSRAWEKSDVDGAMFVIQRIDTPYYSLILANRQSLQDMIEPITALIRLQMQPPYIFFCKPDGEIRGLWFFNDADCERIYNIMHRIVTELQAGKEKCSFITPMPGASSPAPANKSPVEPAASVAPPNDTSSLKDLLARLNKGTQPSNEPAATAPKQTQGISIMGQLFGGSKPPPTPEAPVSATPIVHVADLEKRFLQGEKPSPLKPASPLMGNSTSAASLNAFSTRSVQGSEDHDPSELDSVSIRGAEPGLGGDNDVPLLDREQFRSAIAHLLQHDDDFVTQIHQAYVDVLMNRLSIRPNANS
ncbi:unnamed protein product, partial [Mesorhabditis spiculigera]